MDIPHVTICVPAYNAARTISETLDSIISQDYSNDYVLVCDNLSSDDTAKIVKGYESRTFAISSIQFRRDGVKTIGTMPFHKLKDH